MRKRKLFSNKSGASAIEFAIIAPIFFLVIFGIVCFGVYFSVSNSVEQLAAQAVRASIPGLNDQERNSLARSYIANSLPNYPLLDPANLTVSTQSTASTYAVLINYNMSSSFVFHLGLIPLPAPVIERSAIIQDGGF